jgi:DNA-directed RNA polymerase specialized sigma24 family protein
MTTDDAITVWLDQLLAGEPAAVGLLWEAYFHRLVLLARTRLNEATLRAAVDEEDIALSAFACFCEKVQTGHFQDLKDREGLWALLAVFTVRKAAEYKRKGFRLKRGAGMTAVDIGEVLASDPDPAIAAEVAGEFERLLTALPDPELRRVALLRMDGWSVEDMADEIGCPSRSVKRKLQLIRRIWTREMSDERR